MFKKAYSDFHFDIEQSWMIGDRHSDIAFGKNAGLKNILLLTGNGHKDFIEIIKTNELKPNFVCENLLTAANLIRDFKL
jgi:histidinol phosphatase-like enzyme